MGTRGAMGVRMGGVDYITYNHFDSYPSGLGSAVIQDIHEMGLERIRKLTELVTLVDERAEPTPEQIMFCSTSLNKNVGGPNPQVNWYQLLRKNQGSLQRTLEAGFMISSPGFMLDSLFCEWAYIANLDTGMFEVYRGFQKKPGRGRYGQGDPVEIAERKERSGGGGGVYYGVDLFAELPFDDLPYGLEANYEEVDGVEIMRLVHVSAPSEA